MKTLIIAGLATALIGTNGYSLYDGYQKQRMERACARAFNVYGCHWQLQPMTMQAVNPVEDAPAPAVAPQSSVDPIGQLISATNRGDILPPPAI